LNQREHTNELAASSHPARWLVVGLLAGAAAVGLVELGLTASSANGQSGMGASHRNIIAVAGQVTKDAYGFYLVDVDNNVTAVYQYQPTNRKLRLLASRNFNYDLQLDDYNTWPLPRSIKELVDQQNRLGTSATRPAETEPAEE
jgi:hypothetical protein